MGGECSPRVTIQGLFFVIDLPGTRGILQHVLGLGKKDLASPERHEGEEEEDGPSDAHEDDHDGVPHDEPGQVKDICQDPDDRDETHVREPTIKITNRFWVSDSRWHGEWKGESKQRASPKKTSERSKEQTYVSAQQPRISLRCLWSLNQYGRIPNRNKKTARPNSITPDMTLTAYQTSPAVGVTRS